MWLRRLEIGNLRNLTGVQIDLDPGLNYFFGDNGAGKTAILEAVHLLARGRSFRSPVVADLIRSGADEVLVRAEVQDELRGLQQVGVLRARGGRTELHINARAERRLSQAAELLPLQVMVPALSDLVFGPPSLRRQWLDWGLFHVEHGYLGGLRGYLHALRQRNAALKAIAAGKLEQRSLAPWTEELASLAESVTASRETYLASLMPRLRETLADLAPGLDVDVSYTRGWPGHQEIRKVLGESVPREVKWGVTQSGPHRADVSLRVGTQDAGAMLSRGQGKSLASGLMLAQARALRESARRTSVFLIDDIGAELDSAHNQRFFRLLAEQGAQILATSNIAPDALVGHPDIRTRLFHVEQGRVRRVE